MPQNRRIRTTGLMESRRRKLEKKVAVSFIRGRLFGVATFVVKGRLSLIGSMRSDDLRGPELRGLATTKAVRSKSTGAGCMSTQALVLSESDCDTGRGGLVT